MRRCWQLVMCWGLAGCPRTPAPMAPPEVAQPRPAAPVVELTDTTLDWLSGHFDSSAQANENEAYFAVSLRSCRVTVEGLPERRTLYVEQALVGAGAVPAAHLRGGAGRKRERGADHDLCAECPRGAGGVV